MKSYMPILLAPLTVTGGHPAGIPQQVQHLLLVALAVTVLPAVTARRWLIELSKHFGKRLVGDLADVLPELAAALA